MISALWGVFVWKEFRGASSRVRLYLALMFLCFLLVTDLDRSFSRHPMNGVGGKRGRRGPQVSHIEFAEIRTCV